MPRSNLKSGSKVIGRLSAANPADQERYFLRVLLRHIHGTTSYEDLLLHRGPDLMPLALPDGRAHHSSFREAALALGLMENDALAIETFEHAVKVMPASSLRRLLLRRGPLKPPVVLVVLNGTMQNELAEVSRVVLCKSISK